MTTERAYLSDPLTLDFDAEIVERRALPDGRLGLLLARTYFYPTGGGQEYDTGRLGEPRVVDVFTDEAGDVVHVVDRAVSETKVRASIDRERRLAFMQHHSAQHLLSQAIEKTLGLETIAVRISIDSPSTIDFPSPRVDEGGLERAEALANSIIYEDRPIRSYFVSEADIATVPLRRPPKVSGEIRIVEIEGFDYSACGGTHCTSTGMIGIVTALKSERRGEETRIYFAAGELARRLLKSEHIGLNRLAQRLNANAETAAAALDKQFEQIAMLEKQLKALKEEKLAFEARDLVSRAEGGRVRMVLSKYTDRPIQELRQIGSRLQAEEALVAVLASYDAGKLGLVIAAGARTGVKANELVRALLSPLGMKGGGDGRLAQGGGSATEEQFNRLVEQAGNELQKYGAGRSEDL